MSALEKDTSRGESTPAGHPGPTGRSYRVDRIRQLVARQRAAGRPPKDSEETGP
ncbi:hypothetical protein ACFRFJ_15610 [Streptomyces hydrogenans]|uniref:hypothetical protein n=1 Tax=Streptomyces hydrogenans TaxID=1873719 RepID=UPI0036B91767